MWATEGRGSMMKCGETPFEWMGLVKILWYSPCMMVLWKLLNTFGWIIDACWISRNTLSWYIVVQLVSAQNNKTLMADEDELCENSNPLQDFKFLGTTWWNKEFCNQSRTENGASQTQKKKKLLGPNLVACNLATWTENVVKFKS